MLLPPHPRPRPLLLLLLLCASLTTLAQTDSLPRFPQDFVGDWAGTLEVFNPEGRQMTVPMELLIQPVNDTLYTYTIVYGDRETGTRGYYIHPGPEGPHHWVCDERNGILLDGYYLGGVYASTFTVMGNYLISTIELREEELIYTIVSGREAPVRTSGGKVVEGEEIPPVNAYSVRGFQRSVLRRSR